MAIAFDALKFVETLERASMPREQANAIATAVCDAQDLSSLATKRDLRDLENATDSKSDLLLKNFDLLRKDFELLRSDMRGEFNLIRWMLGTLTAGMGTILVKLFWG